MAPVTRKSQSVEGDFVPIGCCQFTDTTLMDTRVFLAPMTDAWVTQANEPFFRNLEPKHRRVLQLLFAYDYNIAQAAAELGRNTETIRIWLNDALHYLRLHLAQPRLSTRRS